MIHSQLADLKRVFTFQGKKTGATHTSSLQKGCSETPKFTALRSRRNVV